MTGTKDGQAVMANMNKITGPWEEYFALTPVWVDAYSFEETRNGDLSYKVWGEKVLRRWVEAMWDEGLGDEIPAHWEYKPYREQDVGK